MGSYDALGVSPGSDNVTGLYRPALAAAVRRHNTRAALLAQRQWAQGDQQGPQQQADGQGIGA